MDTILHNQDEQIMTAREREILQLIVDGHSNREISSLLNISIRTVEAHRQNLFRKFDVDNIVKLVKMAMDHKWVL